MKKIKEIVNDYPNFWIDGRDCKYPFLHWTITGFVIPMIGVTICLSMQYETRRDNKNSK